MNNDNNVLRRALAANAAFSSITGLIASLMAGSLSDALGPPTWSLRALGVGLLVFAAVTANEAREPRRTGTWQIIAADVGWVIAAAIIVGLSPTWLTETGRTVVVAVTVIVAAVAVAQWRGLESTA